MKEKLAAVIARLQSINKEDFFWTKIEDVLMI